MSKLLTMDNCRLLLMGGGIVLLIYFVLSHFLLILGLGMICLGGYIMLNAVYNQFGFIAIGVIAGGGILLLRAIRQYGYGGVRDNTLYYNMNRTRRNVNKGNRRNYKRGTKRRK